MSQTSRKKSGEKHHRSQSEVHGFTDENAPR